MHGSDIKERERIPGRLSGEFFQFFTYTDAKRLESRWRKQTSWAPRALFTSRATRRSAFLRAEIKVKRIKDGGDERRREIRMSRERKAGRGRITPRSDIPRILHFAQPGTLSLLYKSSAELAINQRSLDRWSRNALPLLLARSSRTRSPAARRACIRDAPRLNDILFAEERDSQRTSRQRNKHSS